MPPQQLIRPHDLGIFPISLYRPAGYYALEVRRRRHAERIPAPQPAQARAAANRDVADRAPSTGRVGALHLFTDPALSLTRPISSVMIAYRRPGSSAIFIVMTDTGSELPIHIQTCSQTHCALSIITRVGITPVTARLGGSSWKHRLQRKNPDLDETGVFTE